MAALPGGRAERVPGGWMGRYLRSRVPGGLGRASAATASVLDCGMGIGGYPIFPWKRDQNPSGVAKPGLARRWSRFCRVEGFRFVRIALPEPHDYSRLAFNAIARLLEIEGRQPAGALVEMFTQFDATAVRQSGLLPLWLIFNTFDSLAFLKSMRPQLPKDRPVFFTPLATFTQTPDLTPWQEWENALEGLDWRNIGTRSTHYPADALTLTNWAEPLHAWVDQHRHPIQGHLKAEELLELAGGLHVVNYTPCGNKFTA